jgi:hypothetical protein
LTQLDVAPTPGVELTREGQRDRRARDDAESARWWGLLVIVAALTALAVWFVSPRFAIDTPSLVDDWSAIANSDGQLADVIRLGNPEEQRFRPGWILWNYLQWHTLDAPGGMVGPNLWNVLRLLVLVAGLSLATMLMLPTPRGRWHGVLQACLAGLPALLVVTVPKFARDFAAFGPQEPLLVGGLALGGSLLVLAAGSLLDLERPLHRWRVAALGVLGSILWIVGAYQKETSLAVLPLVAAVLFVGRRRLASWNRLTAGRRAALTAIAAAVVLPFVHIVVESVRIVLRGDLVYDAEVEGGLGAARGLEDLYHWAHEALPGTWRLLAFAAVLLTMAVAVVRRRVDVLALGTLASGVVALGLAGQSGVVNSRYYIPTFALFMVALALSIARLPPPAQLVSLLIAIFVALPPPGTRAEVQLWADEEQDRSALVLSIADLYQSGCTVATAGLGLEAEQALPVLVRIESQGPPADCESAATYLIVGPEPQGRPLAKACRDGSLERIGEHAGATVYRCGTLGDTPVRDPDLGVVSPEELVELRRLRA